MNKMFLVIGGVAVCIVAAVAIYFGFGQKPQPTPTAYFTEYAKNPVAGKGAPGSWADTNHFWSSIVLKGGVYYLFYSRSTKVVGVHLTAQAALIPGNVTIAYATSTDGYTFTDFKSNPILMNAWSPAPLWDGNKWVLYYYAAVEGNPGGAIWRAIAPDPSGPWTRDENPVLQSGGKDEWDSFAIAPDCVILTDSTYVMYYTAIDSFGMAKGIGRATSPDGIRWTKYNNATAVSPHAESDPVLMPGKDYDLTYVQKSYVRKTATGWEMFYTGEVLSSLHTYPVGGICYATSSDGIHWTKFEGNPILSPSGGVFYYDPTFFVKDSTYFLFYERDTTDSAICVATGAKPPFAP